MKTLLIFFALIPILTFASFPIDSAMQLNDTIVVEGKKYKEVAIDSLYKYPLTNESVKEYRARLKRNSIITSDVNSNRISTPITFWQVLGILAILWLLYLIIYMIQLINLFE